MPQALNRIVHCAIINNAIAALNTSNENGDGCYRSSALTQRAAANRRNAACRRQRPIRHGLYGNYLFDYWIFKGGVEACTILIILLSPRSRAGALD